MNRSTTTPTPSGCPLHVTILGGTGKTGRHVVEQPLRGGHHVTVLARTPNKLDVVLERLRVVAGDVQDPAAVSKAVTGSSAVYAFVLVTRPASRHRDPRACRAPDGRPDRSVAAGARECR